MQIKNGKLEIQQLLIYFYHFSHYISRGACRIGYSKYTDKMDVVAYKCPDEKIIVVVLNRSEEEMQVNIRLDDMVVHFEICPGAIYTGVIECK